jgi:hypothetical protein
VTGSPRVVIGADTYLDTMSLSLQMPENPWQTKSSRLGVDPYSIEAGDDADGTPGSRYR